VEFGDGWLPARITLPTFVKRMAYLREISIQAQRPLTTAGVMPLTSLAKDKETALRYMNVKGLIAEANKNSTWIKPVTGVFATVDDIHGLILAGTSNDIVRGARDYQAAGADLIVFDLRFRVLDWDQQIDWLGNEVLPALRVGARS
jgi:hypothetical protein